MSRRCIVKTTFKIPPQESNKSSYHLDNADVGLRGTGKILKKLFPFILYEYQVEAMNTILAGEDCFLTVGTGAGKTEVFMFTILEELVAEKITNAIIIYPTKQLAEDQEQRLASYCNQIQKETGKKITYSRYNGDLSRKDLE